ncbi:hypothetical protein [uncultured Roseobacter sp.]|uniref:hypothetical protein n=1 Tax=uncultured Roseobacter sp. TaxID=114847 RepID=UPI00262CB6FA|nr:hypothetical protein [uncultured Roseobacter sp.]
MSKSRKPQKRTSRSKSAPAAAEPSRRNVMKLLRNGVIGAAVVGGGGYVALGSFRAYAAEHDLSRLGQGKPAIVQVHDPQCPTCTALQKQTRKALKQFGECDLVYLIADINTPEGQAFAVRHGVGNVTLLLFDGGGGLQQTVQGLQSRDQLLPIFQRHQTAHAVTSG